MSLGRYTRAPDCDFMSGSTHHLLLPSAGGNVAAALQRALLKSLAREGARPGPPAPPAVSFQLMQVSGTSSRAPSPATGPGPAAAAQ